MCQTVLKTRSAPVSETFNVGDEIFRKRTERSVTDHDVSHESMMVNETDMDFRIPGLPHSVVKHAQSTSVRELIQKIENHPDRHALQQDLRQNQSSDTVPLRHRPDFKQALSTLQRLQQEAGEEPQVPTYSYKPTMGGMQLIIYVTRFMVTSLSIRKSRRRCTKY